MRKIWLLLIVVLFPLTIWAQDDAGSPDEAEDDRGFLTRLLEKNLSGEGREVTIDGFEGALSSRATFRKITISDSEGTWLTIEDGSIQWNRAALLRGRVSIAELHATRIDLPRLPATGEEKPTAEAREFALPELPVSIEIAKIDAERVELGEPVIGLQAAISLNGNMSLADGEGQAQLTIDRLDAARGEFVLDAGYSNETKAIKVDLDLDEAADGLLVNLVNLYDKPSVKAQINGEGALSDFSADINLETDGQPRIDGQVDISAELGADGRAGTGFSFELGGDVASLLRPEDRSFFGARTEVSLRGWRGTDGQLLIPELAVGTEALGISGSLDINAQSAPEKANLTIALGRDAGAETVPVALPFGEGDMSVEGGQLRLFYDAAQGQGWTLTGQIHDLDQGQVSIGDLTLDGAGEVLLDENALDEVTGKIDFAAADLGFEDQGMAEAVGSAIKGDARFDFTPGQSFDIPELNIDGSDYGLSGNFLLSGLSAGFLLSADVDAQYQDLARLSTLAGRPVSGQADASLTGYYRVFNRSFDIDATVMGTDITVDQEQADRLLAGESRIELSANRDDTGIDLEHFSINATGLTAQAQGYVNSRASDVTALISMPSLSAADPAYGGGLKAEARLTGATGQRQLNVTGTADDLKIGIEVLDNALQGHTDLTVVAGEKEGSYALETFELANPQLKARGEGSFASGALDATAQFDIPDMAAFKEGWSGDLHANAKLTEADGTRFVDLTGTGQDLSLGHQNVDGALTGKTLLKVQAEERSGVVTLRDVQLNNDQVTALAEGVYGPGVTDISATVDARSLAFLGAGWQGAVSLDGKFKQADEQTRRLELTGTAQDLGIGQSQLDGALAGETRLMVTGTERDGLFSIEEAQIENPRLNASATGRVGAGETDLQASINASDLRFVGNGIGGAVSLDGTLTETDGVRKIAATGQANGLSIGQPKVDPLLRGQTNFALAASQSGTGLSFQRLGLTNSQLSVDASGDTATGLSVDARLNDLALVLPQLPGAVTAAGTVREQGNNFVLDLNATAPGNTNLQISGTAARDFATTDIGISGVANASLANGFLRTRSIAGPLAVDLRLAGTPSLQALTGQVQLSDGELSEPSLGLRLERLNVTAGFQNGNINVDANAGVGAGGQISVVGPVNLSAGNADLDVILDDVVVRDPNLYETRINGDVSFSGSFAEGPLISGRIDLGETELRIPSTGLGGAKSIPDIQHVGDTRPVRATRAKAGIEEYPSQASRDAGMAAPPSTPPANPPRLDLQINAPQRIFVRGRGVDAEMGGELTVQGTTRNAIPIGHLELIRGRVDLLGKRFDLTEGLVELQGSLIPVLTLVAETTQDSITTRIIIDGEARDPDITFESSPELPEEEVLSQLLFGRGLDNISALQAAQLANALAVLAGSGSAGIVSRLRAGTGLDDLDLQTDDDGNVEVRAGKYLSENVYTDVGIGDDGTTDINLNLDITESLRARGSVASDGESSIGIFFERDY
ncbi:translocation/assembly module TamB domain-containing protein [Paracoccus seriniphilus]|uniref:Autotransporter secretion inner membrane protein TamB n=1 Tax=Paracoccus seriniphilus TaxID=184748 RepID=A0A239PXA0_9RHOB|nr:translocation/assembly module TamB domain-containing protein [Paracoccus seriniphilus]WCR14051.1 translocation/assembly module TamB domain-containing protein [Paracoccus seriniphilus]SNT74949.1 autotransporter secretion inner membrane protein TamB [Paracoccus seriniphilus]